MMGERRAVATARRIVEEVREGHLPFLAGSLAFHAFLSLLPLLLLLLIAASVFAGEALAAFILEFARLYLSPTGQELLVEAVTDARDVRGGSLVGLAVLSWSAIRIFWGLDIAFAELYRTRRPTSLRRRLFDALVGLGSIGIALLAAATSTVFALLPSIPVSNLLNSALLVAGLTLAFLPLYWAFPDISVALREALPGAIIAAVGWTVLEQLFQLYVTRAVADAYGVIGGVIVLLMWLYFAALVLLFGVVVNVVLGDHDSRAASDRKRGLLNEDDASA